MYDDCCSFLSAWHHNLHRQRDGVPAVASGDFRVVVFNSKTSMPLTGAKVVALLSDGTTDINHG